MLRVLTPQEEKAKLAWFKRVLDPKNSISNLWKGKGIMFNHNIRHCASGGVKI